MNTARIALAALGAWIAYFVIGGLSFAVLPLAAEYAKYPALYRTQEEMKSVIPAGMAGMLIAMIALAIIYGRTYRPGSGVAQGALFGALVGVFAVGAFVLHNYLNLQIGLRLTLEQAAADLLLWTITGIVIGLIYRPAP